MPQLDTTTFVPQLVWLAITFIALYLILGRRLLPRIAEILESRQDKIAHDLAGAETARAEAEEALAAYDAGLAKARAEAQALHARALEDAAAEAASALAEQGADLAREGVASDRAIDDAKSAAFGEIEGAAADVAQAAVARLTGVQVDAASALAAVKAERT